MSQKTRTALKTGLSTFYPDNITGLITPLATRTQNTDQIDSAGNLVDTNTWAALNNFTGGLQVEGAPVTGTGIVLIIDEASFPVQDATTITLKSKKIYLLGADLSTTKRFIVEDAAVLTSLNILGHVLTYTGTGDMFTGVDASFTIREILINYPNANQAFNFTDNVGGQKLFLSEKTRTVTGTKHGTFNNMQTVLIEGSSHLSLTDGITLTGADWVIISISKLFMNSVDAGFIGIDFTTAVSPTIEIDDFIAIDPTPGAIGIKAAAGSANVPTGQLATVSGCDFNNMDTPISGVSKSDTLRWRFLNNAGIKDSITDSLLSLTANATATVITTISTPVKVAGTWVIEDESLMTGTITGRATYLPEISARLPVDIVVDVEPVSGTNKLIKVYLALNGSIITASGRQVLANSGDPLNVACIWQLSLSAGDYLEVFVENNSDAVDILVSGAVLRVN